MTRALSRFLLATFVLAGAAGCRCGGTSQASKPGEIVVVYVENDFTKSDRTPVFDFGQVPMEKVVTQKMIVKNVGLGALDLESLTKDSGDAVSVGTTGEANPVFKFDDFAPVSIGPGEQAEFTIAFTSPAAMTASVPHESKLTLRAANTVVGAETATVTVKGVSVSGECELPATLDFGAVSRGDSFPLSVKLKNTRPIDALSFVGDITSNSGDDKAFTFSPDSPKGEVSLKAGQEKTVTIAFAPTETKDYLARVSMRRLDGCPDKVVKLIGTGVDAVLTWTPNPLDLGYVTPGLSVNGELTFVNQGLKEVSLTGLKTDKADFKVTATEPVLVPGATRDGTGTLIPGTRKVAVTFKPTLLGPRPGRLDFNTNLPKQSTGVAILKGYGGGPDIDVKPPTLNFGRVAYFAGANPASYVNRKLTLQNVGTKPTPPDPKANLHLGAMGTGPVYWDVRVKAGVANNVADLAEICVGELVNGNCTNKPSATAYDPTLGLEASGAKALLDVPVRVTPNSVGVKEWEVVIHTNDPDEPDFVVTIHADSVVLPPCNYEVSPVTLNFGLVTPPDYKDLSFTITNLGTAPTDLCLISQLDLKPGSDVVFTLPAGPLVDKELQPGQSMAVGVRAWPQGLVPTTPTTISGIVNFSISNPTKPEGNVSLNAVIASSCLTISPDDLYFGTVQKDCSSATRTFTIYNTCATAVKVNSFSMVAPAGAKAGTTDCPGTSDCPEFIPVSTAGIAPNTMINPGATPVTFSMKYHPINYGPDNGAFLIKVTQNAQIVDYIITLSGNGDTMGLNTDTFKQDTKPKADILLVVDNSCSMSDKQMALSVNFGSFIKYATSAQVDYQIGVTSTDMGVEGGRIIGDANNPKVLKPTTVDVENKFKQKVNLGINGSGGEEMLAPAVAALTAPIITAENLGLLRSDAVLAVVVITDADDQSAQPVTFYVNQLLNIKGSQRASQFSFNAVGPYLSSPPAGCSYDGVGGAPRLLSAVTATAGVKEEICTPDWSKALEQIGKNAFGYRTNFFLTSVPDLTAGKTIVVKIDGLQLDPVDVRGATVWTYDSANNSVNFEPLFVPEPGKTLTLTYFVACIP